MVTIAEVIAQVRDIVDEPAAAQYTDKMFVKWINEGNRDLARETRHIKDTVVVPGLSGVATYTLASDILVVEHVYWKRTGDTRQYPLEARHWENMDQVWGVYQDEEFTDPQFYTVLGFSPNAELRLFPVPTDAGSMNLIVARIPAEIDPETFTGAETVETPPSWYDVLADYCEYKALRRDRDPRWQEARNFYVEKRTSLMYSADQLAVNKEIVPSPNSGYLDRWLTDFDD